MYAQPTHALTKKLNPAQYSEPPFRSAASPIKITCNANVWSLKAKSQCIFHKIKHFDDMVLSRMKTAIAHVAHGKVITSVWLYTAGINIIFLHTTLSSNPAIFKTQHYSSTTLKPPRVSEKQDRRTARARKLGFENQVNGKKKQNTSGGKLDCKLL